MNASAIHFEHSARWLIAGLSQLIQSMSGPLWTCLRPEGWEGYLEDMHLDRITVDPGRMGGLPCIRDLRVTVGMILGQLAAGSDRGQVLRDYPYLEEDDITAALEFAAERVNERDVPIAQTA